MSPLVERHVATKARRYLGAFPVLLIEGARQVGKSTLARQLTNDPLVLNLDVPQVLDAVLADPIGALAQAEGRTVVVDEIQLMPELTRSIKALVDEDRRPGRFVLTGSASLLRVTGTQDSLAGRVSRLNLYGFSRGEAIGRREDFVTDVLGTDQFAAYRTETSRTDYIDICARGAYPPVADLDAELRHAWLDDYATGILRRDLGEIRRQVQPERAESVLRLLAAEQATELVKARVAERVGLPASTATAYLDLLESVQLYRPIRPWTPNLAKREVGKSKSVILDSALAMRLAGVTPRQLANLLHQEALGRFLEGFVASELLRQRTWTSVPFELYHYRDTDGAEVDLVMETEDGDVIAIEVKAASSFSAKQFAGLAKLQVALGDRFKAGIVLNTAREGYRYAPKLWGMPIAALWEPISGGHDGRARP